MRSQTLQMATEEGLLPQQQSVTKKRGTKSLTKTMKSLSGTDGKQRNIETLRVVFDCLGKKQH